MEELLARFLQYMDSLNSGSVHTRDAYQRDIREFISFLQAEGVEELQDADRILVLENGQINGLGTHAELLATNAIYQEVYNSQTQGGGDFDKQGGAQ